MKYLLIVLALVIAGCRESSFKVGQCKEYHTAAKCTAEQLDKNRELILTCHNTSATSYRDCENNFATMGCTYDVFVICRQSEQEFISFNKPTETVAYEEAEAFVTESVTQHLENDNALE